MGEDEETKCESCGAQGATLNNVLVQITVDRGEGVSEGSEETLSFCQKCAESEDAHAMALRLLVAVDNEGA